MVTVMREKEQQLIPTKKVMKEPKPTARKRPRSESAMNAPGRGMKLVVATDNRSILVAVPK